MAKHPKVNQQSNPYPPFHADSMRSRAHEVQGEYPNKPLNLASMRRVAQSNQEDHSNKPNAELNRQDKEHGPVKGGC